MIAPQKSNRQKAKTQDGRKLRRYRRRWEVERLFAWLQNYRRILVRYEYHDANYMGFVRLGCILILTQSLFLRWSIARFHYRGSVQHLKSSLRLLPCEPSWTVLR